jgi:Tfp pilus assembly protein PilV
MLATMLLAVGLLGTAGMLTTTTRAQSVNANRSIATTLAKEQLEQIEDADYATVTAANYPAQPYQSIAGFEQFQRTVTIALDTPAANMKLVTVTVSWRDPSNTVHNTTVSSVIIP